MVVPLEEIAKVNQREFSAQQMLRSQNSTALKGNEIVYVMEISLKQSYQKIYKLIDNFNYVNIPELKQPI